jgi:hypothetical protein
VILLILLKTQTLFVPVNQINILESQKYEKKTRIVRRGVVCRRGVDCAKRQSGRNRLLRRRRLRRNLLGGYGGGSSKKDG